MGQVKLCDGARKFLEGYIREKLSKCNDQKERLASFTEIAKSMNPDDCQYFTHMFIGRPAVRKPEVVDKQKQYQNIEQFNASEPAPLKIRKTTFDYPGQKIKPKMSNKQWLKDTRTDNRLLADNLKYWCPTMGGQAAYRRYTRNVLKKWPVYGGSCVKVNGMKLPPKGLKVVASWNVIKFYDENRIKPPTAYKVYGMFDELTDSPSALWAEYKSYEDAPDPEVIIYQFYVDEQQEDGTLKHVKKTRYEFLKL